MNAWNEWSLTPYLLLKQVATNPWHVLKNKFFFLSRFRYALVMWRGFSPGYSGFSPRHPTGTSNFIEAMLRVFPRVLRFSPQHPHMLLGVQIFQIQNSLFSDRTSKFYSETPILIQYSKFQTVHTFISLFI